MVQRCGACHRASDAKVRKSAKVDKRNFVWKKLEYFWCYSYPFLLGSCLYIHVCAQALLSIRWGFDGDFYSPLITPLWWVNSELSSQRHGGESMFYNGSWLDEGELARPSVATITGRTSLGIFLVPAHGYRRCWRHDWAYHSSYSITSIVCNLFRSKIFNYLFYMLRLIHQILQWLMKRDLWRVRFFSS